MRDGDKADGTRLEKTISRATAELEDVFVVRLYRYDDDPLQTYSELCEALVAEAATLDPEQWIDGEFRVGEYVIKACLVGIYGTLEVQAAVVNRGSGETVVEYTGDDDEVLAVRRIVG